MSVIVTGSLSGQPGAWNAPGPGDLPTTSNVLTPREDQVLELIGLGLTNREIGGRLGIAEKTVKNTVTMVLAKLGVQRRAQAIILVTVRRVAAAQQPLRPATSQPVGNNSRSLP